MAKCPHEFVQFCPLYVASHDGAISTLGCITSGEAEFICRVERGRMDYTGAVDRLYKRAPAIWQECRAAQQLHEAREQRRRNLRLNGIHG